MLASGTRWKDIKISQHLLRCCQGILCREEGCGHEKKITKQWPLCGGLCGQEQGSSLCLAFFGVRSHHCVRFSLGSGVITMSGTLFRVRVISVSGTLFRMSSVHTGSGEGCSPAELRPSPLPSRGSEQSHPHASIEAEHEGTATIL